MSNALLIWKNEFRKAFSISKVFGILFNVREAVKVIGVKHCKFYKLFT